MKNHDETINSVFNRIGEYEVAQKRKRKAITRTVTLLCCVCLVALMVFGVWESGMLDTKPIFREQYCRVQAHIGTRRVN